MQPGSYFQYAKALHDMRKIYQKLFEEKSSNLSISIYESGFETAYIENPWGISLSSTNENFQFLSSILYTRWVVWLLALKGTDTVFMFVMVKNSYEDIIRFKRNLQSDD